MEVLHVFMPGLHTHLTAQGMTDSVLQPEEMKIYLPSSIPGSDRPRVCIPGLPEIEDRLRFGQAHKSLSGLRWHLRTRIMARKLSDKNASSQRAYLRSRTLQDQVEARIRATQGRYNIARAALSALRGPGEWEKMLAILKPEDVRGISERSLTQQELDDYRRTCLMAGLPEDANVPVVSFDPRLALGEGQRSLSWIWYSVGEGELEGSPQEIEASA
jgi:hypothetical protein